MSETLKFLPVKRHRGSRNEDNAIGVTETAAAKLLGISRRLVRHGIACGDVKTIVFGGRRYIPHNEIDRLKRIFEGNA